MKKSSRILILAMALEAMLLGICLWLLSGIANGSLRLAVSEAEAVSTITTIMGGAMGLVAGVLGVTWFVIRKRERNEQ